MRSSAACRSKTIAVTPLVRQLILNSTKGQPLRLSREQLKPFNPYAAYLFALLERPLRFFDVSTPLKGHQDLTSTVEIAVPEWQILYGAGGGITPAKEVAFNTFVTANFRKLVADEIALRRSMRPELTLRDVVQETLQRWEIHEDLYPYTAAVRMYYRHTPAPDQAA